MQAEKIQLTWGAATDSGFMSTMQKLIRDQLPMNVAIKMHGLARKINAERELAFEVKERMDAEYLVKVENPPEGTPAFKIKEGMQPKLEEEFQKWRAHTFKTKYEKFPSVYLSHLQLSVADLENIRPLLSDANDIFEEESAEK